MDDAKKKKIAPASVLCLAPDAAAALVRSLDEANRFGLMRGLVRLARAEVLSAPRARAFAAVFEALGRARLKLYTWHLLTQGLTSAEIVSRRDTIDPCIPAMVTGIFNVKVDGEGEGMTPTPSPEDAADIEAAEDAAYDPTAVYAALVAEARAAGALLVEEAV